jgi:hypothetical protein
MAPHIRRTTILDVARDFDCDRERYFFVFAGIGLPS